MKNEKNNFGFIAASSICIFLLLIVLVGNVGGKGTRAFEVTHGETVYVCGSYADVSDVDYEACSDGLCHFFSPENKEYVICDNFRCRTSSCEVKSASDEPADTPSDEPVNIQGCKTYGDNKCTECYGRGKLSSDGKSCTIADIEGCTEYIKTSISTYGNCLTCVKGYKRESGTCVKIDVPSCNVENCGTCDDEDANKCKICLTGFYESNGKCVSKEKLNAPTCKSATYSSSSSSYKFDSSSLTGFEAEKMNAEGCTITLDDIKSGKSSCSLRVGVKDSSKYYFGDNSTSAYVTCDVSGVPDTYGKVLALPSCATNTYDGTSKNLLKSTDNFKVTKNGTATNAGEYTVEVEANTGYYWLIDGQKQTKYSLKCEIDKGRPKFSLSSSSGVVWINTDSSFSVNTIDDGPCGDVSYSLSYSNGSIFTDGKAPAIPKSGNTVSFKATKPGNSSIVITGTSGTGTNSNCAPVSITYNLTVNESVKPYCRYCSNAAYYNYTWISQDLDKPLPEGCSIDANKTSASQCGQCYYCPSNVTDAKSADSNVRGKYVWRTSSSSSSETILGKCNYKESYSDEKLRGLTAWQTAYDKTADTCSGNAPDFNGPSSSSTPGGNNGGNNNGGNDTGSDNGGNNGGIGGGDDTGNNNGGNNNATNNPQTGSALIFVVWSIGIAMVVYAFWYFKTSKEY